MKRKYPFVKQEGIKDCGPACLMMIIKYYHGYIPINKIQELTKTSRLGTDAYHLCQAAETIGFNVKTLKTELKEGMLLPAIAHVTIDKSYNHYIVIYKINMRSNYIIIGDPAKGIVKMKLNEFLKIYNNIFIELVPIRKIPILKNISFWAYILNYIKQLRKYILSIFFSSILITLLSTALSFYFKKMINNYDTSKTLLIEIFLVFSFIQVFKSFTQYIRNKLFVYVEKNINMNMSCDIFNKIIDLPYQYYRNHTTGEIISRFGDLENVKNLYVKILITIFSDMPLILVSILILYFINIRLAIYSSIIIILDAFLNLILQPIIRKYINTLKEKQSIVDSYMTESIVGIETIKNCNIKEKVKEKFSNNYYQMLNYSSKVFKTLNIKDLFEELFNQLGVLIIILLGTILVLESKTTIGSLIMFYSIFTSLNMPLHNLFQLLLDIKESKICLNRMMSVFENEDSKEVVKLNHVDSIELRNLTFYHNDIDCILDKVNLKINSGEKILILGQSGSGKSTLLKLIMKYYKLPNNNLLINNIDINEYDELSLHKTIGYISDKEYIFTDSIINNLENDNIDNSMELINLCEVDKIMHHRNLNLYSIIEENGFNLSGGERQRIALARFLLKDFNVLLIDEGLNQMDINLERRILKRMFKKYNNKIIIVISHRTDNMDLYDRLIRIDSGKIVKDVVKNA